MVGLVRRGVAPVADRGCARSGRAIEILWRDWTQEASVLAGEFDVRLSALGVPDVVHSAVVAASGVGALGDLVEEMREL